MEHTIKLSHDDLRHVISAVMMRRRYFAAEAANEEYEELDRRMFEYSAEECTDLLNTLNKIYDQEDK